MRAVDESRFFESINLAVCLFQPVILPHEDQDIRQTAFDADVKPPHSCFRQLSELNICFAAYVRDGGIQVDHDAGGKVLLYHAQDHQQAFRVHSEGVAVAQKNLRGIASQIVYSFQLVFNLVQRQKTVRQVFEQGAEFAAVVRASHGDRQHKR